MTERTAARLAWSVGALSIASLVVGLFVGVYSDHLFVPDGSSAQLAPTITTCFFVLAFAGMGSLVASRRPSNPIGWLFAASGLCYSIGALGEFFKEFSAGEVVANWLGWIWALGLLLSGTFGLLLFPTGSLPSRRWRPVAWLAGIGTGAFVLGSMFAPGFIQDTKTLNPVGIGGPLGPVFEFLQGGIVLGLVAMVASIASLLFRYRRGDAIEREQLRWLLFAGALIVLGLIAQAVMAPVIKDPDLEVDISNSVISGVVAFVPVAVGIAVLRYRLFDIDVVINKTLVYGSLAGFITAVYVGVVVGIGTLVGRGDEPNLGLSILATGLVAVAFQPVRERVQKVANRLVYGRRATPYEVLSEFGQRMAGTYAADDVLPRMARILAEGTGAMEAKVWLKVAGELAPAASWPETNGDGNAARSDADLSVPVVHQGEELGALSIAKSAGDRVTPAEEKLTRDLASQAGLVLRNVRLIEDLKASRVRLVQAQDQERRRIERNIHDGAQQQLVALQVKLGLTKTLAPQDPAKAEQMLSELQDETNQALQDLRDLARGIYPPLLADQGLVAALEAQARKSPMPVSVQADGIGRYDQDIEAAIYFCVLEALQNVAKYAEATTATVNLVAHDGHLSFQVTDDGKGFDSSAISYGTGLQGMDDRLSALGGEIEIRSEQGSGTTVLGRIGVHRMEGVE